MKTEAAKAASAIRTELKANFPGIKFSVRSQNYAGGNSIRVEYTDGPKAEAVEEITAKYEMGTFNGMEDIYEYDNTNADLPQVKYLFVDRNASKATENMIRTYVERNAPVNINGWELEQWKNRDYRTIFSETDYPEQIHQTA